VAAARALVRSEDPADRVTLDESVSYALLAVLEQLSPAERTAFVLHEDFDVSLSFAIEAVGAPASTS
jgi:RNA polymerase sigma-70 factor, ECF subfamily